MHKGELLSTAWMVDRKKKQMSPVNQRAVLRGIKNRMLQ